MKNIISEYMENLVEKGLSFEELSGTIEFHYAERSRDGGYYHISEEIPKYIVKRGEMAVLEYAKKEISKVQKKWRKKEAIEDNIRKNHIPIQTECRGIRLEGRIIEATSRGISVELDKPLKGQSDINFELASAMAGHYVFTKDHNISEHGYDGARRALCWAYEKALHKPEKDLVKRLNKDGG